MLKFVVITILLVVFFSELFTSKGCLITNCPRGGKRSGRLKLEGINVKPCISCGPGRLGQCFGPSICCGPFGCLFGTQETARCQRDGFFNERQPCIAGSSSCRRDTGRCAAEGVCCSQESCHNDRSCSLDDKPRLASSPSENNNNNIDLLNFLSNEFIASD